MRVGHQFQPGIIRKNPDWVADHVVDLSLDFFFYTGNVTLDITHIGKFIRADDLSAVIYTLPNNLPVGFNVGIIQRNVGQITFVAASGASFHNASNYTKSGGRYAICALIVDDNVTGTAAEYILSGDGAP